MPLESSSSNPEQSRWFTDEVQPHERALRSYLRRSFPTVSDVDDVVQESLFRTWRAYAKKPITSSKAFLFRVARYVSIDEIRRSKKSPIKDLGDTPQLNVLEQSRGVAENASIQERIDLLAKAIDTLPTKCQKVIMLTKLKNMSQIQVAEKLGISVKTVEAHVTRGIHQCREYLRKHGVDKF